MSCQDSNDYDDSFILFAIVTLDAMLFIVFVFTCYCVRRNRRSNTEVECQTEADIQHVVIISPSNQTDLGTYLSHSMYP